MKHTYALRLAYAVSLAVLPGCANDWVGIPPAAKRTVPASFATRTPQCAFALEGIEDRREYPDLWHAEAGSAIDGSSHAEAIRADGLVEWLTSSIKAIPGFAPGGTAAPIRLELLKATIDGIGPVVRTDLVVRVHTREGGRLYRGSDLVSPWSGFSERAAQAGVDRAMGSLLTQMADDSGSWCSTRPRSS